MSRTLAHGRFTKADPGEAFRSAGTIGALGNKGIFGDHLDQLLFEAHGYEHILGSASQVSSNFATMTWDQAQQRFEDKAGDEVILTDHDRIAVIGMDTLTDNLVIDNITGLEIFHIGSTPGQSGENPKFQLGNAGGGVPFKIMFGSGTSECKLDLQTEQTFDFLQFANLTITQRQFIANQGKNNQIKVNGNVIYDPSSAGQIVKYDTQPINPYFLRMDGALKPFTSNAAVDNLAWFRDLNIALDGQRSDGSGGFTENQSRFSPLATSAWLFNLNTANRFFTDISAADSRINLRTDPTGVSILFSISVTNGSNQIGFPGAGFPLAKNGMRINGGSAQGIPDGAVGTTILRNLDTTAETGEMFDALTGAAVNATVTDGSFNITIDNSGAAGGSHDADAFQNIVGSVESRGGNATLVSATGALTLNPGGGATEASTNSVTPPDDDFDLMNFDASNSPSARTHDQTQPISSAVYYYYRT